jgi:flavin-binding protein dodecin
MPNSIYKVIEVVGTSKTSWEDAASVAVKVTGGSIRDLRVAEITKLDMVIDNGGVTLYRARVSLSFKYEAEPAPKAKTKGKSK